MAMYYGNCSSPKFVLEEDGLTMLVLKRYEGTKDSVVVKFRRRDFLTNTMKESELQKMLSKYTEGKKVFIQREIEYLFDKY